MQIKLVVVVVVVVVVVYYTKRQTIALNFSLKLSIFRRVLNAMYYVVFRDINPFRKSEYLKLPNFDL